MNVLVAAVYISKLFHCQDFELICVTGEFVWSTSPFTAADAVRVFIKSNKAGRFYYRWGRFIGLIRTSIQYDAVFLSKAQLLRYYWLRTEYATLIIALQVQRGIKELGLTLLLRTDSSSQNEESGATNTVIELQYKKLWYLSIDITVVLLLEIFCKTRGNIGTLVNACTCSHCLKVIYLPSSVVLSKLSEIIWN